MTGNDYEFREAIGVALGNRPDQLTPGKIVRFGENRSQWAVMSFDRGMCSFGDWRTGYKQTVISGQCAKGYSRDDIAEMRQRATESKRLRDIETYTRHARTELEVSSIYLAGSALPPNFGYIADKQIENYVNIFRLHSDGRAFVPLETVEGRHVNNQYITASGKKRFHPGARVVGAYCVVQRGEADAPVIICEGIATACSVSTIEPHAVVLAAMTAGNLLPVATDVRAREPLTRIIIAGDNDTHTEGNPGRTKAIEAARAIAGDYCVPEFPPGVPGTDFNDLMCAGYL